VRDVIVIEGDEQLRAAGIEVVAPSTSIDATRRLYWHDWSPGETYEIVANGVATPLIAPQVPTPYAVRRVLLEDVAEAAISGVTPDSVVRFAPDSRRLAIGTFHGALLVIDAYSGATLFEHRVSEGMVKSLAWSPDGRWLYAGEQSPDAFLLGIDTGEQSSSHVVKTADEDLTSSSRPSRYSIAWRQRLAERVETSRPAAGDRYAIYTLPAVHDLRVADDGRVFAASTHNWSRDGELTNRSVITCYSADGNQLWSLPPQDAWGLTIAHIDCDRAGKRLVCLPNRTQSTAAPAQPLFTNNIEPGTFYLIDARQGAILAAQPLEPLAPHFARVEAWDSVAISDDGTRAAAGLVDGRVVLCETASDRLGLLRTFELGTPRIVGDLPIAAACSYTRFCGPWLVMQTQNTHIPFGNPQAANQAPSPHPGANRLTVADRDGKELWNYRGPFAISGAWSDAAGRWLLVNCRELAGAGEPAQFGFLLFDTERAGGGADKLVYYYATTGPVNFSADLSPDGRLTAVVEVPAPTPDGRDLFGKHQVHIVH
jgi:outer membrane protein assembly factor BamB